MRWLLLSNDDRGILNFGHCTQRIGIPEIFTREGWCKVSLLDRIFTTSDVFSGQKEFCEISSFVYLAWSSRPLEVF